MSAYVAFLRGVNLGPTRKISMPQLRSLVAELGFADVRTYLNSGNVLLASDETPDAIEVEIAGAIEAAFAHRVDVMVRTVEQLHAVLAANPFPDGDPSRVTVAFLAALPDCQGAKRLEAAAPEHEPYVIAGREVYVHYSQGIGASKLAAGFSAVIGVSATVRNVRTVAKLVEFGDG